MESSNKIKFHHTNEKYKKQIVSLKYCLSRIYYKTKRRKTCKIKSIAIIDEDPDLLNMYSEALKIRSYDVSSFSDPILAYKHIKENPDKYSLLIIDDKMPNVNGLFMGTKLLEINPKLNVIIMCDFANLKCNYKFNILKKRVSIYKLIDAVNESILKSFLYDDKLYNSL